MTEHASARPAHEPGTHVMSPGILVATAASLMVLTAITVTSSRIDLGPWNVVVALAIACTKATIVALFFMHLKYENRFLMVILIAAALFAALFVSFVVFDTVQYQPEIRAADQAVRKGS
ncbi:MAG: cytochrome C oxidase subunit IV family protein [Deltaproteobacteria bacterium]